MYIGSLFLERVQFRVQFQHEASRSFCQEKIEHVQKCDRDHGSDIMRFMTRRTLLASALALPFDYRRSTLSVQPPKP